MISETIKKEEKSLEERGRNPDSYFSVIFYDGSSIDERNCNWDDISTQKRVKYQDGTKTVYECNYSVSKIKIHHENLETEIEVPEDYKVYQAIRSSAVFSENGLMKSAIFARCVGLIKDDEVVEERILNISENIVQGWKK